MGDCGEGSPNVQVESQYDTLRPSIVQLTVVFHVWEPRIGADVILSSSLSRHDD